MKYLKKYESPDKIEDLFLIWNDTDAIAFGIADKDTMLVCDTCMHSDIAFRNGYKGDENYDYDRENLEYPGRLWLDSKIISFWQYPENYDILQDVIRQINTQCEYELDENPHIDDDWKIEIVKNINTHSMDFSIDVEWGDYDFDEEGIYTEIIFIRDYVGSEQRSAAQMAKKHLEVGKGGAEKGFGSRKYDDKLPKGMSLAQYRNKKSKYKFTESFDSFIDKIEEKLSIDEQRTDVSGKVERSKKLVDMKEKILPLLTTNSKYNNGRVFDLKGFSNKGCSLGADKDGFFCYTHRARSKSYKEASKIPQKDINFIKSTG